MPATQRFANANIAQTEALKCAFRDLLLRTPGLSECISGVILYAETLRQTSTDFHRLPQTAADGQAFARLARDAGLRVGIEVDTNAQGLAAHPGAQVTEGLDGLRERLQPHAEMGAYFAKWPGLFTVTGTGQPSPACIEANIRTLTLTCCAGLCQEAGLFPVVEPEDLMDGGHSLAHCQQATEVVLPRVFQQLAWQRADPGVRASRAAQRRVRCRPSHASDRISPALSPLFVHLPALLPNPRQQRMP